jgi:hypothetical protein
VRGGRKRVAAANSELQQLQQQMIDFLQQERQAVGASSHARSRVQQLQVGLSSHVLSRSGSTEPGPQSRLCGAQTTLTECTNFVVCASTKLKGFAQPSKRCTPTLSVHNVQTLCNIQAAYFKLSRQLS